jgi:hypothetical protein
LQCIEKIRHNFWCCSIYKSYVKWDRRCLVEEWAFADWNISHFSCFRLVFNNKILTFKLLISGNKFGFACNIWAYFSANITIHYVVTGIINESQKLSGLLNHTIDSDMKVLNHLLLTLASDHDEQKNKTFIQNCSLKINWLIQQYRSELYYIPVHL